MDIQLISLTTTQLYFEKIEFLEQELNRAIENGKREFSTICETIDRALGITADGASKAVIVYTTGTTIPAMKTSGKMRKRGRKRKS